MKAPLPNSLAWQRIVPYLDRALDLAPAERDAWINELTTTQPEIASAVRELLLEHRQLNSEGFLDKPPLVQAPSLAGKQVGAYTVSRLLGRGGMGEVWLALRHDGRFDGQCAIKFLDASSASPKLAERFRTEGQALARLTHTNIARLIDAGSTDEGRPYLALEYIDGERIDRYCDNQSLSIEDRVRLFVHVVAAVAHAHSQLVIHRDLKPSNVFVTNDGAIKLLDFGVAKLLSADTGVSDSTLTRVEDAALTPEYAAPEQLLGEAPSTATDVYQLGLLLFVLLTGKHPTTITGSRADRMRAALDGPVPQASGFAESRRKQLRGDLDAILAKALRTIPQERYPTAQALQDELLRYLNHEPIQARRGAAWYRARKFIVRHRVLVSATAIVLVTLGIGLFMVNRERVVAEKRFAQLRQLSNKVFDLDSVIRNLPGSTEARQAIVSVSLEYLAGLGDEAYGDQSLSLQIGDAYRRVAEIQGVPIGLTLGDFAKAEQSLLKADDFMTKASAWRSTDKKIVFSYLNIAIDRMIVADSESRDADAEQHARSSLDRAELFLQLPDVNLRDKLAVSGQLNNVALRYSNAHRYDEAATVARRSLELAQGASGNEVDRISGGLSVLANALRGKGDLDGALVTINKSKAIAERTDYFSESNKMAELYGVYLREGRLLGEVGGVNLGRPNEAIDAFQKAYDICDAATRRDLKDYGSRSRLGGAARNLGPLLRDRDPVRALAIYDAAIKAQSEIPNNIASRRYQAELLAGSSYALMNLHRKDEAQARIDAALSMLRDIHDLPTEAIGTDNQRFVVLIAQADLEIRLSRPDHARKLYADLLSKIAKSVQSAQHDLPTAPKIAPLYASLAALNEQLGDHAQAVSFATRRLGLWRAWNEKLPGNAFVTRELEAATTAANLLDRHRLR